jgi:hypothetical protein
LIENLKHDIDPAYIWYPVRSCISWENFKQQLVEIIDYLFCYINWRAVNYHISSRHANLPEWLVLGWKYGTCQNHFTLAVGELVSGGFSHCCKIMYFMGKF